MPRKDDGAALSQRTFSSWNQRYCLSRRQTASL
ncbi:hypothetical protein BN438_2100 [Erwinia amylovora UPN527]|uniref:Uncharacterized protein n=1 Tax=Erwinia amylovora ATCC BAA-2158 TaxID=889211 RepID=E5B6A1_ERWAM|nr:hypothetical protein predicted by Glimmer/Critica [Erwinia amylovora ATCC BAA-2158]CCO86483.1 hypothetical protein BN434_2097 [Erwinia amylovora CFBP 2585]CCO99380.1 hypothetical protein BN438_2100 [Erwinia amylovora UPN527]